MLGLENLTSKDEWAGQTLWDYNAHLDQSKWIWMEIGMDDPCVIGHVSEW